MSSRFDSQRLLTEFTLTRRVIIEWMGIGTGMTLIATVVFATVYTLGTGQTEFGIRMSDAESGIVGFVLAFLLIFVVLILHEAIHAAVVSWYGGDVSFGVGCAQLVLPYLYVTTTQRLDRNQFIVVALAPFVAITVVGVAIMIVLDAAILILPLAVNVGGAIGDLWMVGILLRYPSHVVVEDAVTGIKIHGSDTDGPLPATTARTFLKQTALGSGVGFGLLLLVGLVTPLLLEGLGLQSFTVGVPDSTWSVYAFESTASGFETSIKPIGVITISILLGGLYAFVTTPRFP